MNVSVSVLKLRLLLSDSLLREAKRLHAAACVRSLRTLKSGGTPFRQLSIRMTWWLSLRLWVAAYRLRVTESPNTSERRFATARIAVWKAREKG